MDDVRQFVSQILEKKCGAIMKNDHAAEQKTQNKTAAYVSPPVKTSRPSPTRFHTAFVDYVYVLVSAQLIKSKSMSLLSLVHFG